jgi:nitrite reductase/ring-hydroxylating ferredoxin subunit
LETTSSIAMAGGLIAGYGTLGVMAVRFLYPTRSDTVGWCYVATVDELPPGGSMTFVSPAGAEVVIARQSEGRAAEDFIALSSVCPHLGCQVHWEPHNDRFFCPCHNGVFDPQGNPLEGPPAMAGQQLTRFPLKVENGMLFVEAPLEAVGREVAADDRRVRTAKPPIEEA